MKVLTQREKGLFFMEVSACLQGNVRVGRPGDSKPTTVKLHPYGAIGGLKPGQYSILSVTCTNWSGSGGTTLNGPFATFTIAAGEMVNLGVLKLTYHVEYLGLGGTGCSINPLGAPAPPRLHT
jgi:hypothetical protein